MSKVVLDISMSLDGFVRAAAPTPDEPLGVNGQRLHDWALGDDEGGRAIVTEAVAGVGAVICGRRTYDDSRWNADGPTGSARVPVFVVTGHPPADVPEGGVYTFVTDGIEAALARARVRAGDKDVCVMGGAAIGQAYLRAGLVDEISLHIAPHLFGDGLRLFDSLHRQVSLRQLSCVPTAAAIHVRYQVEDATHA